MFENYSEMSEAEKASVKAIHRAIRAQTRSRAGNLAWGFVRGFPYRRIEARTRVQELPEGGFVVHNRPDPRVITHLLGLAIPGFAEVDPARPWATKAHPDIVAWLKVGEVQLPAPAPHRPLVIPQPTGKRPILLRATPIAVKVAE